MKLSGSKTPYDRDKILRIAEKYRSEGRIWKAIHEYEKILSVDRRENDVHAKIAPLYIRRILLKINDIPSEKNRRKDYILTIEKTTVINR